MLKVLNGLLLTTTFLSAAEREPITTIDEFFKVLLTIETGRSEDDHRVKVTGLDRQHLCQDGKKWWLTEGVIKAHPSNTGQTVNIPRLTRFFEISKAFHQVSVHLWHPLYKSAAPSDGGTITTTYQPDGSWQIKYTLEARMEDSAYRMFERKIKEGGTEKLAEKPEGERYLSQKEIDQITQEATEKLISVGWPKLDFYFNLTSQQPVRPSQSTRAAPSAQQQSYGQSAGYAGSSHTHDQRSYAQSTSAPSSPYGQSTGYSGSSNTQYQPPKLTMDDFQREFQVFWSKLKLPATDKETIQEECNSIVGSFLDEYQQTKAKAILKGKDVLITFLNNLPDNILSKNFIISALKSFTDKTECKKFEILNDILSEEDRSLIEDPDLILALVRLPSIRVERLLERIESIERKSQSLKIGGRDEYFNLEGLSLAESRIFLQGLCHYYSSARGDNHVKRVAQYGNDPETCFDAELRERRRIFYGYITEDKLKDVTSKIRSALPILKYIPGEKDKIFELIFTNSDLGKEIQVIDTWLQGALAMAKKEERVIDLSQDLAINAILYADSLLPENVKPNFLKKLYGEKHNQISVRKLVFNLIRHSTTSISHVVMEEISKFFKEINIPSDLSDAKIEFIRSMLNSVKNNGQLQELQRKLAIFKDEKKMKGRNLKSKKVDPEAKLQVIARLLGLEKSSIESFLSVDGLFSKKVKLNIDDVNEYINSINQTASSSS